MKKQVVRIINQDIEDEILDAKYWKYMDREYEKYCEKEWERLYGEVFTMESQVDGAN